MASEIIRPSFGDAEGFRPQTASPPFEERQDAENGNQLWEEPDPTRVQSRLRSRSGQSRDARFLFRPSTANQIELPVGLDEGRPNSRQNAGQVGTSGRSGGDSLRPRTCPLPSDQTPGRLLIGGLSRMRRKDYRDLKELAAYGKTLKPQDRKKLASAKKDERRAAFAEELAEEKRGGGEQSLSSLRRRSLQPPSSAYPEVEAPPPLMMQRAMSPPKQTVARRQRPHTTGSMRSQYIPGGGSSEIFGKGGSRPRTGVSRGRETSGVTVDEEGNILLMGDMEGRYVGEMAGGLPEGQGQHWVPDRNGGGMRLLYDGEWLLGVKMGKGTIFYRNGQVYTGDVVDGDRHGIGRLTYTSGDVFHGAWFHGRKVGYGIQFYSDGTIYAGMWANDCREGLATFYWPNRGKKYTGEWVKNAPVCGSVESIRAGEVKKLQYPAPQRPFAKRSENLDLPPLEVLQPGLSVYEKVTAVRGARARTTVPSTSKPTKACLRPFQTEALKHAFVTLAGDTRPDNPLKTSKLLDVCLTAGFRPDSKEINKLMGTLLQKAHGSGVITFDAFLEVLLWIQI